MHAPQGDGTFTAIVTNMTIGGAAVDKYKCAWADYNNDGYFDAFFMDANYALVAWRNEGTGLGAFTSVDLGDLTAQTTAAGSDVLEWADYDNDGLVDVFTATGLFKVTRQTRPPSLPNHARAADRSPPHGGDRLMMHACCLPLRDTSGLRHTALVPASPCQNSPSNSGTTGAASWPFTLRTGSQTGISPSATLIKSAGWGDCARERAIPTARQPTPARAQHSARQPAHTTCARAPLCVLS